MTDDPNDRPAITDDDVSAFCRAAADALESGYLDDEPRPEGVALYRLAGQGPIRETIRLAGVRSLVVSGVFDEVTPTRIEEVRTAVRAGLEDFLNRRKP